MAWNKYIKPASNTGIWIHTAGSTLSLCTVLLGLGWTGIEAAAATVSRQSKEAELGEIPIIAIFLK